MTRSSKKVLSLSMIAPSKPKSTEIAYVTSVDPASLTFFAQLCKFSYEELNQFEICIDKYCTDVLVMRSKKEPTLKRPAKPKSGNVCCAKYKNGRWYRAVLLGKVQDTDMWSVLFLDYGNVSHFQVEDLIEIDPEDLSELRREPFGITCFFRECQDFTEDEASHYMKTLKHNYLLIKIIEKQSNVQWIIDIPEHAYNTPFWHKFQPELAKIQKNRALNANSTKLRTMSTSSTEEEGSRTSSSSICGPTKSTSLKRPPEMLSPSNRIIKNKNFASDEQGHGANELEVSATGVKSMRRIKSGPQTMRQQTLEASCSDGLADTTVSNLVIDESFAE